MCGCIMKIIDSVFSCFWPLKLALYGEKFGNQKSGFQEVGTTLCTNQRNKWRGAKMTSIVDLLRPLSRNNCQCFTTRWVPWSSNLNKFCFSEWLKFQCENEREIKLKTQNKQICSIFSLNRLGCLSTWEGLSRKAKDW